MYTLGVLFGAPNCLPLSGGISLNVPERFPESYFKFLTLFVLLPEKGGLTIILACCCCLWFGTILSEYCPCVSDWSLWCVFQVNFSCSDAILVVKGVRMFISRTVGRGQGVRQTIEADITDTGRVSCRLADY